MSVKAKTSLAVMLSFLIFSAIVSCKLSCYLKDYFFLNYFWKDTSPPAIVRVTIPEGYTIEKIADKFENFENFNKENFLKILDGKEGYLFPDTYFFSSFESEKEIARVMEENFADKAGEASREVVIMASILEKEALTFEDKKIVSGILWKRLNAGMPLQVDAVFVYIIGKKSSELTLDDLKIDSPYNTYLYNGLPPAPICNPGMESILAALEPEESFYWYYLSDKNHNLHFAENFDEHKINKAKYLR